MTLIVFVDTETTGLYEHYGHEVWEVAAIVVDGDRSVTEYEWQLPVDLSRADPMALSISGFYGRRWPASSTMDVAASAEVRGRVTLFDEAMIRKLAERYGEQSTEVTEARQRTVTRATSMAAWAQSFARLTDGATWVGAVPDFDSRFLGNLLRRYGACQGWHYHLIDVEVLAAGWLNGRASAAYRLEEPMQSIGMGWRSAADDVGRPPWDSDRLSSAVGVDPDQFDRHSALGDARWAKAIYDTVMDG